MRPTQGAANAAGDRVRLSAKTPPNLPAATAAWTQDGTTSLGVPWLFADRSTRQKILRHEAIHRLHHSLAPRRDSPGDRAHAEQVAEAGAAGRVDGRALARPAPDLLAFAPINPAPFSRVWVGCTGVVAELEEDEVVVRIFLSYEDLGLGGGPRPHQAFYCGAQVALPFDTYAEKMRAAGQQAAELNRHIDESTQARRVALVYVYPVPDMKEQSAYQIVAGKGAVSLSKQDFLATGLDTLRDTLAHEGSHAMFTAFMDKDMSDPQQFAPRFADLYARLSRTPPVPIPTQRIDQAHPPVAAPADGSGKPAGVVMVLDTLWGTQGGHPWDTVDEFFASSFAGYVRQPARLRAAIDYYTRVDPKIGAMRSELLRLLDEAAGKSRTASPEQQIDAAEAGAVLRAVEPAPEVAVPEPGQPATPNPAEQDNLVNPAAMKTPPDREMNCPPK